MQSRTIGAICLRPIGNVQDTNFFMSLQTSQVITRHRWTELLIPIDVITRVNDMALSQNIIQMEQLLFITFT